MCNFCCLFMCVKAVTVFYLPLNITETAKIQINRCHNIKAVVFYIRVFYKDKQSLRNTVRERTFILSSVVLLTKYVTAVYPSLLTKHADDSK